MMTKRSQFSLAMLAAACGLVVTDAAAQRTVLFDAGGEWKFLNTETDPGTAWREPGFDDSAWPSGRAPIGFGEADIVTDVGRAPGRAATYLRAEFELAPELLAVIRQFDLEMRRDDGAVVYLNGFEIRRDHLPEGEITGTTFAVRTVGGTEESEFFTSSHLAKWLVAGTNVLAVGLHNSTTTSSDLVLDLKLIGDEQEPFFGRTRPPASLDFETVDYATETGRELNRDWNPAYSGIEYFYESTGGLIGGGIFRTSIELLGGEAFDSTALGALNAGLDFETRPIDVSNYTDVRVSMDIRTEGGLTDSDNRIDLRTELTRDRDAPESRHWISIGPDTGRPTTFTSLFPERGPVVYQIPTDPQVPIADWIQLAFDDSGWVSSTLGVGYEGSGAGTFLPYLGDDLTPVLRYVNASLNIRVPISLEAADLVDVDDLYLDIRYDDGFVAWLNGTEIARRNAPDILDWNAEATATHSDADAVIYQRILVENGVALLREGDNVLAIRGLNATPGSADMLIQPQLIAARVDPIPPDMLSYYAGEFETIETEQGSIPDDTTSLRLRIDTNRDKTNVFYFDNIKVTGVPIEPDSFVTAVALEPGLDGIDIVANPDPEGDGIPLLLEYAFGGGFLQADDPTALLPLVGYDGSGAMTVQFRMLDGYREGDPGDGYDVADLRYTPQLSYDLLNWQDGTSGAPPFDQVGDIVENGDGTVTVTVRSTRPLQAEEGRAYVRVLVEVVRPPQVVLSDPSLAD